MIKQSGRNEKKCCSEILHKARKAYIRCSKHKYQDGRLYFIEQKFELFYSNSPFERTCFPTNVGKPTFVGGPRERRNSVKLTLTRYANQVLFRKFINVNNIKLRIAGFLMVFFAPKNGSLPKEVKEGQHGLFEKSAFFMAKMQRYRIEIDGHVLPVKEYRERRRGARFSFGKDAILFRMPLGLLPQQEKECRDWFRQTLNKRIRQQPELAQNYSVKTYQSGDVIRVGARSYRLHIEYVPRKTHSAKLRDGVIYLRLVNVNDPFRLEKAIKTLLSRVISQDFKPTIEQRVHQLNEQYFQKEVKSVNLKYNQSNWGSCSAKCNINLSSRLLFAPDDVIDYVIIHELAHLIEMNHSPRFWRLVARAMPDYKQKEQWLKANRAACDF